MIIEIIELWTLRLRSWSKGSVHSDFRNLKVTVCIMERCSKGLDYRLSSENEWNLEGDRFRRCAKFTF